MIKEMNTNVLLMTCFQMNNLQYVFEFNIWASDFDVVYIVSCGQVLKHAGISSNSTLIPEVDHFGVVEKIIQENFQVTQVIKS